VRDYKTTPHFLDDESGENFRRIFEQIRYCVLLQIATQAGLHGQLYCYGEFVTWLDFYFCDCLQCTASWRHHNACK
jgi:hypothetical protein